MARKGKKKRRNKNPKLTTMQDVVAKAATSRKLIRMWQDSLLKDEVIDLKQRLEKAQGERDSLRKRAAEREDQQEAVFDTLKDRVVVAQAEIQVRVPALLSLQVLCLNTACVLKPFCGQEPN